MRSLMPLMMTATTRPPSTASMTRPCPPNSEVPLPQAATTAISVAATPARATTLRGLLRIGCALLPDRSARHHEPYRRRRWPSVLDTVRPGRGKQGESQRGRRRHTPMLHGDGLPLGIAHAVEVNPDRIHRGRRADVEHVALRPAEREIRDDLRTMQLAG